MALNKKEKEVIDSLVNKLLVYRKKNNEKSIYYDAKATLKSLGSSLDNQQKKLNTCSGYGRTVVDTIAARMKVESINTGGIKELDIIVKQNRFKRLVSEQIPDILLYGTGYLFVGVGDVSIGEPETLITAESPMLCIGDDNARTRRLKNFLKVVSDGKDFTYGSFYTETEVVYFKFLRNAIPKIALEGNGFNNNPYTFIEVSRETHPWKVIPAIRVANMRRTSDTSGESEISKSIMYFIDAINRSYGNAEWNSEYYAHPKRFLAGVDLSRYTNEDGTPNVQAVSALMSDILIVGKEDTPDGGSSVTPEVGQLQSASPAPYVDLIKQFASEIAREKFIPEYYLNAGNSTPTSIEAMTGSEHPLNLSILTRSDIIGEAYLEALKIALLIKTGFVPEEFVEVEIEWKDTTTISIAARTDAWTKLVASGTVPADSSIAQTFIPFNASQKKILVKEQSETSIESRSKLAAVIRDAGANIAKSNSVVAASVADITGN